MNFQGNHTVVDDPRVALPESWVSSFSKGAKNNRATDAGRGADSSAWPVDALISRGYALATFYCGDVAPDDKGHGLDMGVFPHYREPGQAKRGPHDWGAIAAWAWGLSRSIDYLTTDRDIDPDKIAVMGWSRQGKAALVASAFDERIALVIPHQAGCGGSAPSRSKVGESVQRINNGNPHWFAPQFKSFNEQPEKLPFDQNALVALVAPRAVLFTNGVGDTGANPEGQFQVLQAAEPVYRLLGARGLDAPRMPEVNTLVASPLGFHIRPGTHSIGREDWVVFLRYADDRFGRSPDAKSTREPGPEPTLKSGDQGAAVEDLQRRLNARLAPSPELDIDGDYGDATRAAVVRFQRAQGVASTGIADAPTRLALGNAPIAVPAVPAPEVINVEEPRKLPPDSLDGPPFVTSKAWAVTDGKTGTLLAGGRENEPLPFASTTKMMTALVVLRLAERHPGALEEILTFSERADRTPGSTSGVRAGERLPVRELLYGLLLPSGNDAATALAEHFGNRVAPPVYAPEEIDPLPRFIAEMNRVADELGLRTTHFVNPHGLPASGHLASPRDLATLARQALTRPDFARVVSTRKHGCTLTDAAGQTRNVVWSNTNHLLEIEGYDGVKTGTTTAAGACLIASGRRGDRHLIVVILGAGTSDSRYTDARNLFRWGWGKAPESLNKKPIAP